MKRVHLVISGDVQGVGFRAWVLRQAQDLRLVGWVKNREHGCVEIVAEGSNENIKKLIQDCHHGPEVALVKKVEVTRENATSEFIGFDVVY